MIQDADLEYDPEDYIPMLRALIRQISSTRCTAAAT